MKRIVFLLLFFPFVVLAFPAEDPVGDIQESGLPLGGGTMYGPIALSVCTQTADDTTPSVGLIPGGCNIFETSASNTGAGAGDITDFDDELVGQFVWIVGTGGTHPTNIANGGNFELEGDWTAEDLGLGQPALFLYVQAADDFVEISRHNGIRYFDDRVVIGSADLDAATGDEYAVNVTYATDKATSGDDYGIRVRQTDTASPGISYLIDLGVGANSQFYVTNTGSLVLYGSSWTDSIQMNHDETDAYFKWDDGTLVLQTDEGTDTATYVDVKPKGTSDVSSIQLYDTNAVELLLLAGSNTGIIKSANGILELQDDVVQNVELWNSIASGNPSFVINGWNTAGSDLESTAFIMDDTNDEFLVQTPNSANHEGVSVHFQEANQKFRVRGSDGNVDFSADESGTTIVNNATFNANADIEGYACFGNGTALSSNKTVVIDRDFSDSSDGEALSVTGSQITVTDGTGDVHHTMMNPGATNFSTNATVHAYATSLNVLEPNITLSDGATVTHAATVRIVDAPTEGGTSNYALWVDSGNAQFDGDLDVDGTATIGAISMSGDLDMADNSIKNPLDGIYGEAPTADTDPDDILIHAEHNYSQGSQTASNLILGGGIDEKYFTSTDYANSTNDTLTISIGKCASGVCGIANTTLTESTNWDCDITSDAVCACALYDYIVANPITGISVGRTDGTCSDGKVFIQPDDATTYYVDLSVSDAGGGGIWGTATNGTDGLVASVQYAVGRAYHSTIDVNGTTKTFDFSTHGNDVSNRFVSYMDRASDSHSPTMFMGRTRGTHVSPTVVADNDIIGQIESAGWDGTDMARGAQIRMSVDGTPGADDMPTEIEFLTSPDGSQTPAVNMSIEPDGTVCIEDNDIKNVNQIYRAAPTTDTTPDPIYIDAANAYSQATGGNQTGASLYLGAGIGTRQVIIDDFNNCGSDTIGVEVDGSANTLTEGVDWTAATSNDATATSLASAIDALSGVSASATSAVVYIVPVINTAEVNLTEGDATCTTLTEATDGTVFIGNHLYGYPDNTWNLGASGGPGRFKHAYFTGVIQGSSITLNYDVTVGATRFYEWGALTHLYAPVDGAIKISNGAATTGVSLYATTTGVLEIRDYATTGQGALVTLNATLDNETTGSTANSGLLTLSGNNSASDYQTDATIQLLSGNDPYIRIAVDDDCTAGAGTLTNVMDIHDTIIANSTSGLTSFGDTTNHANYFNEFYGQEMVLADTNQSNHLTVTFNEDDTSDRTLGVGVSSGNRTIDIEGNTTVDQDYSVDGNVQFATVSVNNSGIHILDTGGDHDYILATGSDVTADRTLTISIPDQATALTLEDSATLDQDYSSDALPGWDGITITQEDIGANCTANQIRVDTGGGTVEFCICTATNTWHCADLGANTD